MKKLLVTCFFFVIVLCVALFVYPGGAEPDTSYNDHDGDGGIGGCTTWWRWTENCPVGADRAQAVHCGEGGIEQCSATNCND